MPLPDGPRRAIAGIVLAAGMSTRLGRPKQLLQIDGKPLIAHVVERARRSGLDEVVVVVGHEADAVRGALDGLTVTIVENPDYASGQASSLIAGLEASADRVDAIVVALGDQPGIEPVVIDRLITARRNGAMLAMTLYGSARGHPVMFGHELFGELREIRGDRGGRDVIRRHERDLVLVPGGSGSVPEDIDTVEAYERLLERGLA